MNWSRPGAQEAKMKTDLAAAPVTKKPEATKLAVATKAEAQKLAADAAKYKADSKAHEGRGGCGCEGVRCR